MRTKLPDNEINKELSNRLNGLWVGGQRFAFYVSRVVNENPSNYIFVNTQLNQPQSTMCGTGWLHSTQLQIVVRLGRNQGSKFLLNEATQQVLVRLKEFHLPKTSQLVVNGMELSVENELSEITTSQVIYQKILRLELTIT